MLAITTISLDIAQSVFQVHGVVRINAWLLRSEGRPCCSRVIKSVLAIKRTPALRGKRSEAPQTSFLGHAGQYDISSSRHR